MDAAVDRFKKEIDEEVVVLLRSMKHPVNLGYDCHIVKILRFFNGVPVRTLRGLLAVAGAVLEAPGGPSCEFLRFSFSEDEASDVDSIVLLSAHIKAADRQIIESHRI